MYDEGGAVLESVHSDGLPSLVLGWMSIEQYQCFSTMLSSHIHLHYVIAPFFHPPTQWSPDNYQLASGGNDNQLHVWSAHSSSPLFKFR